MTLGRKHPNLVAMFSYINLASISLEQVSIGYASTHLIRYLTVVIIYLAPIHPPGIGNGPMKSIPHISNFRLGFTDIMGNFHAW